MVTAWSLQDPHVKRLAGKEEITTLAEVMDPDHQDVIPCGDREEYLWHSCNPLRHLLILPLPVIKVNGKAQQP